MQRQWAQIQCCKPVVPKVWSGDLEILQGLGPQSLSAKQQH